MPLSMRSPSWPSSILNWLMRSVLNNGAVLLFIIFQPELRKVLEQVGRGAGFEHNGSSRSENERIIAEIDRLTEQIRPEVERDYGRFQLKVEDWEWNVQWMRDFILDNDWNQICVNNLCYYLNVGAEERARYFSK